MQASAFQRDGFTVLKGFLYADEVQALRRAVDAILTAPLPPGCARPNNTLAPLRWDDEIVGRVLTAQPRRAALADAIAAEDLRWISAYVSVKDATTEALWWHQDWWCWDHRATYRPEPVQVAVLCYLSDTSPECGALRVLPGTHRRSVPLHAALPEAHAREAGELSATDTAMRDHPGQVTLDVQAGDAVVTDYRLLHGTHPNDGPRRRDCLLFSFTPSWRGLPADIQAHLIRHPALPGPAERRSLEPWWHGLLPSYDGHPRDLPLSRVAPSRFEMLEA
jgi:ectoine hydroxylase-related dioxygenase (phytanoyl-CoA dioxygenase family)